MDQYIYATTRKSQEHHLAFIKRRPPLRGWRACYVSPDTPPWVYLKKLPLKRHGGREVRHMVEYFLGAKNEM